jgi:hypothetical protein
MLYIGGRLISVCAKGAAFTLSLGTTPGFVGAPNVTAESAIHLAIGLRLNRAFSAR